MRLTLRSLDSRPHRYRVRAADAGGRALGPARAVSVAAGGRAPVRLQLPARRGAWTGRVEVRDARGAVVAVAPLAGFPPRAPQGGALGPPRVRTAGGVTQAIVRVGRRARVGDRIRSEPLHGVRVALVPADGSAPLVIAGAGGRHDWQPGVYRLVITRRLPAGGRVPAGRYRLRVSALTAEGRPVSRTSAAFRLG